MTESESSTTGYQSLNDQHNDTNEHSTPLLKLSDAIGDKWNDSNFANKICEILFHIQARDTTISNEVYYGIIQFISCLYVLPVIPNQMSAAGYSKGATVEAIAISCGIGCIIAGLFANLPFIVAPPTSISIFLAVFLRQDNLDSNTGRMGVIFSGVLLMLLGWRPLGQFIAKLIPLPIQAGTAIGIGMITALAGATEVNLVVSGKFTILNIGQLTPEVIVAIGGLVLVTTAMHYHVKGAFCVTLVVGTVTWWLYSDTWPSKYLARWEDKDQISWGDIGRIDWDHALYKKTMLLTFDLLFLYVLTLNGLARSLCDLSALTRTDGSVPRGRWLFIVCGATTIFSGFVGGPPILISPESAAGIKAGARTGLSTLVCGVLFLFSTLLMPMFSAVPPAGTSPLLIIVGVVLFQNVLRVEWHVVKDAVPAFCALFFIPFTYSILEGVALAYLMYILVTLFTGDLLLNGRALLSPYFSNILKRPDPTARTLLPDPKRDSISLSLDPTIPTPAMDHSCDVIVVNMGYAEMIDDMRIRTRRQSSVTNTDGGGRNRSGSKDSLVDERTCLIPAV